MTRLIACLRIPPRAGLLPRAAAAAAPRAQLTPYPQFVQYRACAASPAGRPRFAFAGAPMTDRSNHFRHHLARRRAEPGASMTREEKLRIAKQLERLRVDVIEAGFAASSNGDFDAVQSIANAIKDSTVCSLARANDRDISRAAEALAGREVEAHPYLHRDLGAAHGKEVAHVAGAGARAGEALGALRAPIHRRRRVLAGGRLSLGARLPVSRARGRDREGATHDQYPGHGRLRGA